MLFCFRIQRNDYCQRGVRSLYVLELRTKQIEKMPSCIVRGCHHSTSRKGLDPGIVLHGFPKNLNRIKQWLIMTQQNYGNLEAFAQKVQNGKKHNSYRICSAHFSPDCYIYLGRTKGLKADAVPTIFAWNTPEGRENSSNRVYPQRLCQCMRKKMVDASTLTDLESPDSAVGEKWKVKHDHHYHLGSSRKSTQKPTVDHDLEKDSVDTSNIKNNPDDDDDEDEISFIRVDPFYSGISEITGADRFMDFAPSPHKVRDGMQNMFRSTEHTFPVDNDVAVLDVVHQRKFIVFESCLDVLLRKLSCGFGVNCSAPIVGLEKYVEGSYLSVVGRCSKGHRFHLWDSQPVVGDIALGNLLTSAALLFSGSRFCKVEEMSRLLGLQLISRNTYHKYQRTLLFPTVAKYWLHEHKQLKEAVGSKKLCLSVDGQSSTFSTYTFTEPESKQILDFQVVQKAKTSTSQEIEKLAFETCLDRLLKERFVVETISTDQHPGIEELMCEKYGSVCHKYDVWLYAQEVKRQLVAASKRRKCSQISKWIPAIIQHLEWVSRTSHGDVALFREKWQSLLMHITNRHKSDSSIVCHACRHKALNRCLRSLPWIKKWTPAFHALREVVLSSNLTKDMARFSQFSLGKDILLYRRLLKKYRPSDVRFRMDSADARTKLAALTYNAYMHTGQRRPKVSPRATGGSDLQIDKVDNWSALSSTSKPNLNGHLLRMMVDAIKLCSTNSKQRV
ncbi:RNA pseudouridylate synthase domain-containing protein 1 isoform X2 [Xenopus tropicalis]|uniref:RNA pseudouridine synthase domain containing 1 n=1 Tax=Xenopus tropicalis TaxID=8364 RepID=A0A6I8RE67_XENTR|nr:RNA pseudouridylate synthase domain-containing protein 1 isoform X2 [Xenopus tropicalis]